MELKHICVAGSGVLGYQIAFQTAYYGFQVMVYDVNEDAIEKAKLKFDQLAQAYKRDLTALDESLAHTKSNLQYTTDLAEALRYADLLIEAIPENPALKKEFYTKAGELAPAHCIFASNSSTMLPSQFAADTGRPDRFLALHFANEIWKHNTAEIMGHAGTDPKVFQTVEEFAKAIGMIPLPLHKEQPGYILNSLLVPLLDAACHLLVNDVADVQTIDKTWMLATGAPLGPFAILDVVGLNTAYNINKMRADLTADLSKAKIAQYLKTNFIDQDKLGVSTGDGFYTYPNPAYQNNDFLK